MLSEGARAISAIENQILRIVGSSAAGALAAGAKSLKQSSKHKIRTHVGDSYHNAAVRFIGSIIYTLSSLKVDIQKVDPP